MAKKILVVIILLAFALRFYHWSNLSVFKSDQVIELSGAGDILHGKFTLIGIKTSISEVRNGAVMYYLLAPLVWLFAGDPLAGAVLQTGLQIGAMLLTYLTLAKTSVRAGLLASLLLALWPLLIGYSRQTQLAFYPLFFYALLFYLFSKKAPPLILGLLAGVMLQIHYSSLIAIVFCLVFLHFLPKKVAAWGFGLLIGFSPLIFFELRHDFFNLHALLATLGHPTNNLNLAQNYHYFIGFFIPAILLAAKFLVKSKLPAILIPLIFFLTVRTVFDIKDWTVSQTKEAVGLILVNFHSPYNVAMLTGGESQALPLRYFLDKTPTPPGSISQYDQAKYLYLVTERETNLDKVFLPELNQFGVRDQCGSWPLSRSFQLLLLCKS